MNMETCVTCKTEFDSDEWMVCPACARRLAEWRREQDNKREEG